METLAELWVQQGLQQRSIEYSLELATRVLRMLQRFGSIDHDAQEQVRTLPFEQLADLVEAIVEFRSLGDFTAWMRQHPVKEQEIRIN